MTGRLLIIAVCLSLSVLASGSELERGWWHDSGAHGCRLCRSAWSGMPLAFDEDSGRSLLNYPPDRDVDIRRMVLEIEIPDMDTPFLRGLQRLEFEPIGTDASTMRLDAAGPMRILAVRADGRQCDFEHADDELRISLRTPVSLGAVGTLEIEYEVTEPPEGIHWTPASDAWPDRPAQLHTQGEPESNRYWFPMHDFPNERLATELIVTVPAGFSAISNGRLIDVEESGGTARYHWRQQREHVGYLVTLVVGKFDIVDVGSDSMPMPVFVPPGTAPMVKQTYGRTGRMMEHFESLIDEPFPWDKYAQVVVWNFAFGGMENTSATTMYDTAILDRRSLQDDDLDGLIAHELAHQWFGDLITCRSWQHLWLNEGFATYFTHLWFEERDGGGAYQWGVLRSADSVLADDTGFAPEQPALASKAYDHPIQVFRRRANPYPKGASVLHMLRERLGDDLFFDAVAEYVDTHADQSVETDQLRRVFEAVSGENLERFFEQWCDRPGVPRLQIDAAWSDGVLTLELEQTQRIDDENPAFDLRIPVWIDTGRSGRWAELATDARTGSLSIGLDRAPRSVVLDPRLSVLCESTVRQPGSWWVRQADRGPTLIARVRALRAMTELDASALPDGALGLAMRLANRSREHFGIRQHAVDLVETHGTVEDLLALDRGRPNDARVRRRIIERLADAGTEALPDTRATILARLRDALVSDGSYAVRAAAARGLGQVGDRSILPDLAEALRMESQHDQIRRAALDALGTLGEPEGLPIARRFAEPGQPSFTRPNAIRTMATLADHNLDATRDTLAEYLGSREVRTVRAAAAALATIGDRESEAILDGALRIAPGASTRHIIRSALQSIQDED